MSHDETPLAAPVGKVFLVGGGPGDPGLLTLRGRKCLEQADLVLYDGLVSPLLLSHTRADCERTSRVQGPQGARLDQEEINQRLVAAARAGKTVVRLKGGDPFLFGRGGEEAAALREAGIPFEVVPGVTASLGAAAYAGLSLTHREHASCVAFITGHENPFKKSSSVDFEALARFPGTLVFYMGLHRLPDIVTALMEAGYDAKTPGCVVCRATTSHQKIVEGPLRELPERVARAELRAPSLIILGETISQRTPPSWFERRPLLGQRIAITRAAQQTDEIIEQVVELGGEPVLMPLLEIGPPDSWADVDRVIGRVADFDWILFTSSNGVEYFLNRLWERGLDGRALAGIEIIAIGPGTARRLEQFRLRVDRIPDNYQAEGLVEHLGEDAAGRTILWVGANRGRDVIVNGLRALGGTVEKVAVYENRDVAELSAENLDLLRQGLVDWIPLASPAMARRLAELLPPGSRDYLDSQIRLASISSLTTEAAREVGLPIAVEAEEATWAGILRAIGLTPIA